MKLGVGPVGDLVVLANGNGRIDRERRPARLVVRGKDPVPVGVAYRPPALGECPRRADMAMVSRRGRWFESKQKRSNASGSDGGSAPTS